MNTLPEGFDHITRLHASRTALVFNDTRLTFDELRARVNSLARELQRRNIQVGDCVGVMFRNSPDFVVAYWSILNAGAVAVPLNDHYQQNEIAYFVDACNLKMILTGES